MESNNKDNKEILDTKDIPDSKEILNIEESKNSISDKIDINENKSNDKLSRFKEFCNSNGISTQNILAITVQINRTSTFSSMIIDWESNKVIENYPIQFLTEYKEKRIGEYMISYKSDLPLLKQEIVLIKPNLNFPCCTNMALYKPRATARDDCFKGLVSSFGNFQDIVFEVKIQINDGPLLGTVYYQVLKNKRVIYEGESPKNKIHSFKNYKCTTHDLFFMIDLYSITAVSNFHHMRLNPVTKH